MRKLKLLIAACALLLGAGGLYAQTDVTATYIQNASFEYSAEGVAYTDETKLSSGGTIYGWTLPELGDGWYDIQVTPKSSASTGDKTFGQSLPSDGDFYFYNRKGWSTVATSLTQTATLPAGKYFITVDYKAAEWNGYRTKLGFKVADQELINTFCAARFTATTTYFADVDWKTLGAWFTVEEEGAVKIEIIETLGGNDRRADICLDNVKLYKWDLNDETNYDNATKSNPIDVTAKFVTNPYFDNNKDGWTSTTGYQNNGRATNQAGAISGGYYENWNNGSANTSGKMYQTLSGLPDGIFRVTAAAFVNNANANVSLFAGLQKTPVNSTTPSLYSVQTTVNGGSLEIGLELGDGNAANWIGLDNVKLEYLGFDIDAAIAGIQEQATAAQAHLSDKAYTGYITNLQNAINAINSLNSETATKASISTAAENLNNALAAVSNSVADYANLQTNINNAKAYSVVNSANASDYAAAISAAETVYANASVESTAATILSLQNYKTLDYTYITTTYTENSAIGTWTENFAEDLDGEGYVAGGAKYWNEWGSATRTAKQTVTLPAGDYAVSVIGRGNTGTSGYLYYKLGDADPVTVDFLMKGNRGRGVETSGVANFADDGTYNCNGEGFGWEYRFLTFTLTEETSVELGVSATFANSWVSIYAPQLLTTEATVKSMTLSFINNELTNNIPDGNMNKDVQSELNAKKTAAQNASLSNTKEELNTILEELRTAIANASASIAAYTSAGEKLPLMKVIVDATNVYTAEALEAYYTTPKAKYDNNTLTTEEANALVDPNATTGYRSENLAVSQFLISAWDSELNDWAGMHVNTWSAATDFGETGFAVPLVEYWVGSGSLGAKTMTATVSGLEAGNYKVSADMFIKAAALPTGASLQIGDAAAATITGTQNGDFFVSNASSFGTVANDGVLTIKLIVAEGNNFSWIGFKNMKYEKVNVDYANLNAAIAQANAVNAKIAGGVKSLTDAIATAEALLNSFVQSDIDAGVEALNAAITAAETTIIARVNLKGAVKKATALNPFLAESIEADITAASEYAANAEATAAEADSKAAALLANFDSWKKVALTNADFDTDPNILASSISESAVLIYAEKEDPHAYEQTGWTNAMTYGNNASFAKSSVYGSSMAVMNKVAAPATDLFGKNEGATLGLSSGWSNQARFNQTIASLPAGKYVIYYEAYNNYSSQNGINSNYFGVSGLEAGSLEGTNDTFVYDDTKTFPYGEWTVAAKGFQLNKSQSDVKMEIGIIGSTGSSNNAAKIWVDNVVIYVLEESAIAEDADYTALNTAIEAAEAKKLGFEKDEFAPYNNIAAQEALVAAKAIDQTTENLKENITALTEAMNSWTANTENVDAIFNGNFAEELKGWKRNSNWGQMQTGLEGDYATAYYNQPGSLVYGETGFYTMPLAANTAYKLTFAYRSHEDNSNNGVTASVLNGEDGLTATSFEKNGSTTDWKTGVKVFKTGAAGNYVLTLANNGNTWMTGVSVVKATLSDVAPELAAVKSEATALLGNAEYDNVTGNEKTELNTAAKTTPEETIDAYLALIDEIKAKMTAFTAAKASYDNYVAEKANAERIAASITENVSAPTTAAEAVAALQTILVGEYNYVKENYNSNAAETYGMTIDKWIGTATSGGKDDTPQTNSNEKWGNAATTYYEQGKNGWGSSAWTLNYSITKTLPAGEYVLKIAARASEGTTAQLKATVGEETITENLPNVSATGKGITTSGVASFDEGEFANNNNGYGWQWRYLIVKLDEEKEVTFQIDASANSYNQWCSFGDVAIISTVNVSELTAAYNNFEMKTLGFQKDEYAPYQNAELLSAYSQAKAIVEGEAEPDTQEGVNALTATLKAAAWTVNTEDVDAIFNGNFAEELKGWKRTNNWGQMQTGLEGDYATAYYNQPGSLVYGETGVYTMPLAGNTAYKLTFAYRSHEDGSNINMTVSVLNGEDGLAATRLEGNASKTEWKTGVKVFKTGAAGNYVLTLANNGNTWMTGVSIVKAEIENITIAENADYTPAETYADVTFKRTVMEGWNGMVLPFDATVDEVKSAFGATAVKDFAGIAYDEAKGVTLKFQDATEVKAGRPFMLKAAAGASYTFNRVVLPATGLQNIEMVDETNSNVKYTMKGTYAATTDLSDVNFALINGTKFFYHTAGVNSSSAKAFRAYFENNSTEPASARVSFDFGDDETTGIEEIRQNAAANGQYYDLQGRKVQNLNKKGVYLLNGKKVTVK